MTDRSDQPIDACLPPQRLRQCVQQAAHYQSHLQRWSWPQQQTQHASEAAILIPFFAAPEASADKGVSKAHARSGSLRMLLTRRARHLRRHAGQMSFPGGVIEPGDASLLATAMRETTEETGIHGDFIQPLAKLGDMLTISGYRLHVYMGWLQPGFTVLPDPNEVDAVFMPAAETALDAHNYQWQQRETPAGHVRMPEMQLEQQRVWGITAVIIWHLSCLWHQHSNIMADGQNISPAPAWPQSDTQQHSAGKRSKQ